MEFKIRLEAVCIGIDNDNKTIESIINSSKKVDSIINQLMDTYWTGASRNQFEVNVKEWQSQMGKFLEEAESINKSFSDILNKTTIELQQRSDAFIECFKK